MSSVTSAQHLHAIHGLLFRIPPEDLQCPEIGRLLGDQGGRQSPAAWVELRVNRILEQCDFEFMTMVLFTERAFWVSAIERVTGEWQEAIPPYHFIRLIKAILTARYNYIARHGFLLPDSDVANSADILLFNFLLYKEVHQTEFGTSGVSGVGLGWGSDTVENCIEASRLHKAQRWTRIHGSAPFPFYDLSNPRVFDEVTAFIRNRGPPARTLESLQEEYEARRGEFL
ncbi:hypothetical protein CEP54_001359 [Fusarium duplospermum]|uniref:Uncharacterized protein n=1 Tax=Fusarium duplospermum TaxID=1325734 RepID=A0A428R1X2_9HYPO|nr:hypothetical protein CEP54_001359 [Fusarium duplospermum]